MTKLGPLQGKPQPTPKPDARTMHECRWEPLAELTIPRDWISGVYLGRLTTLPEADDQPYWQSYVVFIVRDNRPASVLFQCSDNTWQAYNGRPNRAIFRGGPYGGSNQWIEARMQKHGPFPERGPDEGYLIGARNSSPINGGGDWICVKPEHWIFAGTGMKKGDRVPGLIGWEYHGDPPTDLPGLEIVGQGTAFQGGIKPSPWTATIYPGPKGNSVFNAATIFWRQGLSMPPGHTLPWSHWSRPHGPDPRVQQITRNLLQRAGCLP